MKELKKIFISEALEILQNLESEIVNYEETKNPEIINTIFRYVHTLKGSSAMSGFTEVSEYTHKLENMLEAARSGILDVNESFIEILLNSMDWIKAAVSGNGERTGLEKIERELNRNIDKYMQKGIHSGNIKTAEAASNSESSDSKAEINGSNENLDYRLFSIRAFFRESIFRQGIDPLKLIGDLSSLGRITKRKADRSRVPAFYELDPEKCYLNWHILIKSKYSKEKIEDVFRFVKDSNKIIIKDITSKNSISEKLQTYKLGEIMLSRNIITEDELSKALEYQETSGKKIAELIVEKGYASDEDVKKALQEQSNIKKRMDSTTVRVATDKLDKLLNLLGEIVIGQSAINRVAEDLNEEDGERVKNAVFGLDRTTKEFQEQLMEIRMTPIGPAFEQFKRFVRDTSKALGKDIRFVIKGGETELDKTVVEKIGDPLKHMIRNAIDHGIEKSEERVKLDKNAKGLISINAYHQEGNVFIEISDDGKGIDQNKLRKKAEELNLLTSTDELSDDKLLNLLFLPGFSTVEKVGDLSGRGVGMDVVKTNIEELNGSVKIITEINKGTTFIIKLPLTLAIIDGMLIRVGGYIYIIPLLSIVESIQPTEKIVKTIEKKGEVVYVRNSYIPLYRMSDLFDVKPDYKTPWDALIVIVESNREMLALLVDEIIGQQQIVVKNIDTGLIKNRAISGASILGDGRVSLIIDINGLMEDIIAYKKIA